MLTRWLDSWADSAACGRPGINPDWFSETWYGTYPYREQAKRVCATCPVVADCLFHALHKSEPYGIWGGYDARERKHLKRRRVPLQKAIDDLRFRYARERHRVA